MRNEQALTDRFEQACGSVFCAQQLFHIYKDSYPHHDINPRYAKTKDQVFRARAEREGFTRKQIQAFYDCQ